MNTTRTPSRQAGWNLIELMVVVSIITILLAILINTAVEGKGPESQTKITLRAAMAIATEYEVQTTLRIDHFNGNVSGSPTEKSGGRFCFDAWKLDKTRTMLMALGRDAVTANGNNAPSDIKDGWGRAVRYYSGLGTSATGDNSIHQGATTTATLQASGMPTSKDPYFASAGPDGKWGTLDANNKPPVSPAAGHESNDNIYSFQLD